MLPGGTESVAVVGRCDTQTAVERAAQRLRGAEAVPPCDGLDGVAGLGEGPFRRLDAYALDIRCGRGAEFGGEPALEVAGLSPACAARSVMPCRAPGSAWIAETTARRGSVDGCLDHSGTLNCDWLPGRRRNNTISCATACATSRPTSSSTRASARSIPAVTPADVHTRPSLRKIGSQSTASSGCSRTSCCSRAQCVVARRPCSSPAAARRNTPLHTEATRRAPAPASAIQPVSTGS